MRAWRTSHGSRHAGLAGNAICAARAPRSTAAPPRPAPELQRWALAPARQVEKVRATSQPPAHVCKGQRVWLRMQKRERHLPCAAAAATELPPCAPAAAVPPCAAPLQAVVPLCPPSHPAQHSAWQRWGGARRGEQRRWGGRPSHCHLRGRSQLPAAGYQPHSQASPMPCSPHPSVHVEARHGCAASREGLQPDLARQRRHAAALCCKLPVMLGVFGWSAGREATLRGKDQ